MQRSEASAPADETVRRYRYRTAVLVGNWRNSRDVAIEDAVAAKQAVREPTEASELRWIVPGRIEEEEI
jgi:hypothetical protein